MERDHEIYKAIGTAIRNRRRGLRLSQLRLANAVGISRASLSNLEAGRQQLYVHHLVALASALGTSVSQLLPAESSPAQLQTELSALDRKALQFVRSARKQASG